MTKVWIDGDGCPRGAVQFALAEGERRGLEVWLVTNVHHEQKSKHRLVVDGHAQAVDLAILNRLQAGDVVITQDIGLAAMALGRGSYALHPGGTEYLQTEMPLLLEMREAAAKHRRGGGRTRGPKKRSNHDQDHFQFHFMSLLDRISGST